MCSVIENTRNQSPGLNSDNYALRFRDFIQRMSQADPEALFGVSSRQQRG